jgi:ankyrin repeat protein
MPDERGIQPIIKRLGLVFFLLFSVIPAGAEPLTSKDLRHSGKLSSPPDNSSAFSQPNPMGRGTRDPRLAGKAVRPFEASKHVTISLFYAIGDDDVEGARSLIMQGADPNANVPGSDMKLLMAVQSAAMTKMLLLYGSNPNLTDDKGATALHYLVTNPSAPEIVPMLIGSGANINKSAEELGNRTPLHEACQWYFEGRDHSIGERVIRLLVSSGADINATEYLGKTLLHKAVENNKPDLLILLLELGADPTIKDRDGMTPLESAQHLKLDDIITVLNKKMLQR